MRNYNLGFLSDKEFYIAVRKTLESSTQWFSNDDYDSQRMQICNLHLLLLGKQCGWSIHNDGFDVINFNNHIFAKFSRGQNFMDLENLLNSYMRMQSKLLDDKDALCILVETISKPSVDIVWKVVIDGRAHSHKKIRRMSMDKFYELVFGDPQAFYKLCVALPQIIEDVVKDNPRLTLKNTVFKELTSEHADILTSLYLLAFSTYEGFSV